MAFRTERVRERISHPGAIVRELFFSKNKFQRLAEGNLVNSDTPRAAGSVRRSTELAVSRQVREAS